MSERPILFSAPMVRAILDGRKTQTRRAVKPQPPAGHSWHGFTLSSTHSADEGKAVFARGESPHLVDAHRVRCPYGQPGDRLWVRETWAIHDQGFDSAEESEFVIYGADAAKPIPKRWRPSIHMPRWASRITLEVTGVRVERLQDISERDAICEGCSGGHGAIPGYGYNATAFEQFRHLWESINGAGSWDANPWVWVVEFRRIAVEATNV